MGKTGKKENLKRKVGRMGKHEAPTPVKIPTVVKVVTHHGAHCAGIVFLHVIALFILGKLTPVLAIVGIAH